MAQHGCPGITHFSFHGELGLDVNLATVTSEDRDDDARNHEGRRDHDDSNELHQHRYCHVDEETKVGGYGFIDWTEVSEILLQKTVKGAYRLV